MRAFADLYRRLDETTSTNRKIDAMVDYFRKAPEADAIWAVSFLIGRKPRQVVPTQKLREWAAERAGVPDWLFDAGYDVVGDLAETITLLLPVPPAPVIARCTYGSNGTCSPCGICRRSISAVKSWMPGSGWMNPSDLSGTN